MPGVQQQRQRKGPQCILPTAGQIGGQTGKGEKPEQATPQPQMKEVGIGLQRKGEAENQTELLVNRIGAAVLRTGVPRSLCLVVQIAFIRKVHFTQKTY